MYTKFYIYSMRVNTLFSQGKILQNKIAFGGNNEVIFQFVQSIGK